MQSGFWIVLTAFGGGGTSKEIEETKKQKKQNLRLSQEIRNLQEEERAVVNTISRNLFNTFSNESDPLAAIIIRQSKSWKHVNSMFYLVDTKEYTKNLWRDRWLAQINTLRGHQKTVHDTGKLLLGLMDKGGNSKLESTLKKTMAEAKSRITEGVNDAQHELQKDMQNKTLTADPHCKRVMDFMIANWPYLTVFATWTEVPMDTEKLAVRVRAPTLAELDSDLLSSGDLSTKAFFITEKVDNALIVKNHEIAPEVSHEQPSGLKRRASTVQLIHEEFTEFLCDEQMDVGQRLAEIAKGKQSAKTSMGDRLHYLVNLALDQTTQELAMKDGTEYEGPSASQSQGLRVDRSYFLRSIWGN